MCQIILDKLFVKFQQFLKMEHLKLPSYLNTLEKYNEMIRATDTVKKYEEVFYNLLGDCCDMGQNDTIGKIELIPLSSCQVIILIARMTFNSFSSCLMS